MWFPGGCGRGFSGCSVMDGVVVVVIVIVADDEQRLPRSVSETCK